MHRRARAWVAAVVSALILAPATAHAATITATEPCVRAIPEQQTMSVTGNGFRPGGPVTIQADGQAIGNATADAAGNVAATLFPPAFSSADTNDQTFQLSAVDDQGNAAPAVPVRVVRVTADIPDQARVTSRVLYRVFGFVTGRNVYLHIRRGGRTRGTFKIAQAKGPCGIASRRLRYMPVRRFTAGTYDYVFQHTSRYRASEPGIVLGIQIVQPPR